MLRSGRRCYGIFPLVMDPSVRCIPFAIGFILLSSSLTGQVVTVDTLHAAQPWGERTAYTFPSIQVHGEEEITERINRTLFIDFLGVDPRNSTEPLSSLWGEDTGNGMPRVNTLSWTCTRTSVGVLTVAFSGESCAAYCEGFDQHFLFDLRTGLRIAPDRLFKEDEASVAYSMIDQRWRKIIEHHIGSLEVTDDRSEETKETIELYRTCLNERPHGKPFIQDLLLEPDGLQFIVARCSSHAEQALDDLGALPVYVYYYEILDQLRPEAKSAFDW